jgi:hypothetical protein
MAANNSLQKVTQCHMIACTYLDNFDGISEFLKVRFTENSNERIRKYKLDVTET